VSGVDPFCFLDVQVRIGCFDDIMLSSPAENQIMPRDKFPPGVIAELNWYVYRLIDPRNGETFYVGKGQGDRIFQHVKAALSVLRTKMLPI
jgi:hypothetical protein